MVLWTGRHGTLNRSKQFDLLDEKFRQRNESQKEVARLKNELTKGQLRCEELQGQLKKLEAANRQVSLSRPMVRFKLLTGSGTSPFFSSMSLNKLRGFHNSASSLLRARQFFVLPTTLSICFMQNFLRQARAFSLLSKNLTSARD